MVVFYDCRIEGYKVKGGNDFLSLSLSLSFVLSDILEAITILSSSFFPFLWLLA
jgi:hypothetical protein